MSRVTTGTFPGPAGPIEYLLNQPDELSLCRRSALLCHPHPLFGGTMHTRIVFQMNKALNDMGMPVLRFNFRGVGRSAGEHDHGRGEVEDARAALAFLRQHFPLPVVLGGFSFGSAIALDLLEQAPDPAIERALIVGMPAGSRSLSIPRRWHGPKLFISGTRDNFASVEQIRDCFDRMPEPKRLLLVDGADHFLAGRMDEFRDLLIANLDFESD